MGAVVLYVGLIEAAGDRVHVMKPDPGEGTGAMTFTADGALVYDHGRAVILANDGPRGVLEPGWAGWAAGSAVTVGRRISGPGATCADTCAGWGGGM